MEELLVTLGCSFQSYAPTHVDCPVAPGEAMLFIADAMARPGHDIGLFLCTACLTLQVYARRYMDGSVVRLGAVIDGGVAAFSCGVNARGGGCSPESAPA
jgi:hypothetical protein